MEERIKELENILKGKCEKYENDCNTCSYQKECKEFLRLYEYEYLNLYPSRR